ncbi:probable protein phosphatase 2C 4 isoform X2 [Manihot esculenta]|uniref:Uncharacterized protein n=1 Tax=Manihot esculenta TaxID=3983 RepID=A0ACB7GVR5_MANES|nr:probable protein phosphatase 2C 4 isoform X2 [Manihot esculenta]KAG8644464.1 hypothetical protein MANES_11G130900v8 [Manihot esculenta]
MGNGIGKLTVCFTGAGEARRRQDISMFISDPFDEGLGHSFCYVRPDPIRLSCSKVHSEETNTFRTISGASVSANTSTPLSTAFVDPYVYNSMDRAAAFESSTSFASIPLQPIPRNLIGSINSGPLTGMTGLIPGSGPLERGFMSGPIERGFMSGPLDRGLFSGPLERGGSDQFQRSFSHASFPFKPRSAKRKLIRVLQRAISKTLSRGQNSMVTPIKGVIREPDWILNPEKQHNENLTVSSINLSNDGSLEDDDSFESQTLQWAQGRAGEDRVHVVVSEEHEWVFVGIYDGFNGPDATDYLSSNLYSAVHKELKGLLWDDKFESATISAPASSPVGSQGTNSTLETVLQSSQRNDECSRCLDQENHPCTSHNASFDSNSNRKRKSRGKYKGAAKKWEENQMRWKCEWDRERIELDERLKKQLNRSGSDNGAINHAGVLKALSQALKKTEEAYLDIADKMLMENPELALMGSCVLVMLMKGEDVYVMNVGDSRAVLAQKADPDYRLGKSRQDLERINEETLYDLETYECERTNSISTLTAFQLSVDHSTNLEEPKWNNAILETFRIDYIGNSPYINCLPYLCHHRLGPKDRFLILSSDGLYQYFTNEEAINEVELFIALQPEGDPAQHLIEEVLFRAANKAGMDFYELLEIPQGDRRRYHDDISIIVISLEGRIWRSCV